MRIFLVFLLLACGLIAAPMTLKELDFLVRQRTPEGEILKEAAHRKLVAPLNSQVVQVLKQNGASDALLGALQNPQLVLPAAESQAEHQRQMTATQRAAVELAKDREALSARMKSDAMLAARKEKMETMRRALAGNVVRLEGDQMRVVDVGELKEVRVFAIYYSSMSSLESRRFTPKLVESYRRLKQLYPTEFELIWVSCDRDEFNMGLHMRTLRMPWPAARYGSAREFFQQYAGSTMPWLVAIADTGEALTENAVTKQQVEPEKIVEGIESVLARLK